MTWKRQEPGGPRSLFLLPRPEPAKPPHPVAVARISPPVQNRPSSQTPLPPGVTGHLPRCSVSSAWRSTSCVAAGAGAGDPVGNARASAAPSAAFETKASASPAAMTRQRCGSMTSPPPAPVPEMWRLRAPPRGLDGPPESWTARRGQDVVPDVGAPVTASCGSRSRARGLRAPQAGEEQALVQTLIAFEQDRFPCRAGAEGRC